MSIRLETAVLATALWFMLATLFSATPRVTAAEVHQAAHKTSPTPPSLAVGKLGRQQGRYVLLDNRGALIAYLLPRKSLPVDKFMGKLVAVTVSKSTGEANRQPRLWVDDIQYLSAQRMGGPVQTAAYRRADSPQATVLAHYNAPAQQPHVVLDPNAACPQNACVISDKPMVDPKIGCGPGSRFWVDAQYLLWWNNGQSIPPLVTTSPAGTPSENAGVLGEPNTQILYGNQDILTKAMHGGRVRSGIWLDQNNMLGIQSEFFGFGTQNTQFFSESNANGSPILARPFFNINPRDPIFNTLDPPARQDSQLISFPDDLSGSIKIDASTQFQSAGIAIRSNLAGDVLGSNSKTQYSRVDMITGYRYLRLKDRLEFTQNLNSLNPIVAVSLDIFDRFDTQNVFQGVDLGGVWEAGWNQWSVECLFKTGIGSVLQKVNIQGRTSISPVNGPTPTYIGGLLAQQSNIGTYSQSRFAVLPELGVTLGYKVLPRWKLTAGYTFLYLGSVARPGNQIDLDINPDQLPPVVNPVEGAYRPVFEINESTFWAQGMNFGLQGSW